MKEKTKIFIHLKSGKYLVYYSTAPSPRDTWTAILADNEGCASFGNYVVPKKEIEYVAIVP